MTYTITDSVVSRVLRILGGTNQFSGGTRFAEDELEILYNKRYPLSRFAQLMGQRPANEEIKRAVEFLVQEGYVQKELTYIYDRVYKNPIRVYDITPKGIQYCAKKKR